MMYCAWRWVLVVHKLAHVAHHGRRFQPGSYSAGNSGMAGRSRKSCSACWRTGSACLGSTPSLTSGQHALPALPLEHLVGGSFSILFGQHLVQDAVSQPEF